MRQNTNPWGEAANQAVGAMYKYYMSKPNPAEMQQNQFRNQLLQAQTATQRAQQDRLGVQTQLDQRRLDSADGIAKVVGGFYAPSEAEGPTMDGSPLMVDPSTEVVNDRIRQGRGELMRQAANFTIASPNDFSDVLGGFYTGAGAPEDMTAGMQDMGDLSAPVKNYKFRQELIDAGADPAQFDAYVRANQKLDLGDQQILASGVTALPRETYGAGIAPERKIEDDRIIDTPGVAMGNRPTGASPISDALLDAVIQQESGGDPNALSPVGAAGIMQIMPDTARDPGFGVQPLQSWDGVDPRTAPVEEQIRFGRDYLAAMKQENGGDEQLALAAYNAGPGAVDKYGGIPPYEETNNYVETITNNVAQNQPTITELPASPTAQAKQDETERLRNIQGDLVNDDIDRALGTLGSSNMVAGFSGNLLKNLPGSSAFDFSEMLGTIKANIGFDKLQSMRDASPTGGALGQVSEFENKLLQAVFGSLEQAQSPGQLKYNLMRLQNVYNDIIYRGYNDDGSLRSENDLGPQMHNLPSARNIINMETPEQLDEVLQFFDYDPPDDIEQAVIQRVNQLGL